MMLFAELLVSLLLVVGGLFVLIGSFGLFKLNDVMRRLHAPTKATTVGVGGVLLGSMAYFAFFEGHISVHELLVTLFLFLTAPITANMIAKAHLHLTGESTIKLPPSGSERGWATFEAPPTIESVEPAVTPDS